MSHINSIEAVWNQSKGMVLVLIEGEGLSVQLDLPPDNAEQLAEAILAAKRVPEKAREMAAPDKVETVADMIRREAFERNEGVYIGGPVSSAMADCAAIKRHPDHAQNGVDAESYNQ